MVSEKEDLHDDRKVSKLFRDEIKGTERGGSDLEETF